VEKGTEKQVGASGTGIDILIDLHGRINFGIGQLPAYHKRAGRMKFKASMIILTLLFFCVSAWAMGPEVITIGDFSAGRLKGWQVKKFKDESLYHLTEVSGMQVLRAHSHASASGLFKKVRIDLEKYPFLNWRWRIENRLTGLDEQKKTGDDYGARIYVVVSGGLKFWNTRTLNYVWADTSPAGHVWPNAFAGKNAMMLALRSRRDAVATWYTEKRNIYQDFKQVFGKSVRYIDAIALMTDTDNSGGLVTAYYGDIYFSAQ